MFATTITTAFAFLASSTSPIMPIYSFGYFAAILIMINYFLVIFHLPAAMALKEKILIKKMHKK